MLRLVVTHGKEELVYAIPEKEVMLGSAAGNDIVLVIPGISRRHALVRRRPGGFEIANLKSTNGLLVKRQRVERATLTPGLRVQIGDAWLEVEEVSTSEEALARLTENPSVSPVRPGPQTAPVGAKEDPRNLSPEKEALDLAYHIAQVGTGLPEKRSDLLLRIRAILGAEALATLDRTRFGRLRIWESVGTFSPREAKLLTSIAGETSKEAILKRADKILIAGQDSWFLAARFTDETLAREGWRKEFLRFLASQFCRPVRTLEYIERAEAYRVRILTRGNKKKAAELLGIARNTLDKLLGRNNRPKSPILS